MAPEPEPLLLSVGAAARVLGLSRRALYALIERHHLPPGVVVKLGRRLYFRRLVILTWLGDGADPPGEGSKEADDGR